MTNAPDVYAAESIPESAREEIKSLLSDGDLFRYTSGKDSPAFALEQEFAKFMGVPFALSVNSCSSALFLSLKALGLDQGARVIIPAFTFAAVPSSIVHANCTPVLVNVDDNYRINLKDFAHKIKGDIQAVMISHMRGQTSDMDAIMAMCEERNIPIIEDAAHSLGTEWSGKKIGTLGKIGCFSFQSYKLVNAGEGGILITDDPDIIARAIIMSGAYEKNWAKHPVVSDRFKAWQNKLPLFNLRMNNLSAAVARSQIPEISNRVKNGLANHDYVATKLNQSPHLYVPPSLPQEKRAPDSIQFNLVGFESDETVFAFQQHARDKGIDVQVFGLSNDNARAFWNWQFIDQQSDLDATRQILKRACDVRLPARLQREDLDTISNIILASAEAAAVLERKDQMVERAALA